MVWVRVCFRFIVWVKIGARIRVSFKVRVSIRVSRLGLVLLLGFGFQG